MTVEFCGLSLAHPVINGSGTFDAIAAAGVFGEQLRSRFPFAAYVSKTITLQARAGNRPPRLWEAPGGLINSIGLPNKGLERYLAEDLPELCRLQTLPARRAGVGGCATARQEADSSARQADSPQTQPAHAMAVPLITNIMGSTADEFCELVDACAAREEIAALELNVSCPNVSTGLDIGADPGQLERLLASVRARTRKPLIVKLTPNTADVAACAAGAQAGGADAVSLINTLRAMSFTRAGSAQTGVPWLGAGTGGLSGPAVRPVALAQVAAVAGKVTIPVVGMGGVETAAHARDFFAAGAALIAVGTASFRDPAVAARIAAELAS